MLKLSIITICYNAEKTLQDAMDSVFMQTYPNYEYILINGLSKDSTEQIIKKNAPRLAHWQTEQDKGLYDALNKGVAKATGDVLAFLHADDMYADESVFERVVQIFEKENCDAVFGDLRFVAEDNVQETKRIWRMPLGSFGCGFMPAHPALFVRKKLFDKYGAFDTTYKIAGDYDWMLRALYQSRSKMVYLPHFLVNMRMGGASTKNIHSRILALQEDYRAWQKIEKNPLPIIFALFCKRLRKVLQFFVKK